MILQERGLWDSSLKLTCKDKSKCNCNCCARSILSSQDDFKNQGSLLEELLESQDQIVWFYPKFHCELNWIERDWERARLLLAETAHKPSLDFGKPSRPHSLMFQITQSSDISTKQFASLKHMLKTWNTKQASSSPMLIRIGGFTTI